MSRQPFEVAIIGAGISGLTLAVALHSRNIPVTIYEQAAQLTTTGAGVSFQPNAIQAMKICHSEVFEAFKRVCSSNTSPSKQKVWFDFFSGFDHQEEPLPLFSITNDLGQNAAHRSSFIEEIKKLLPLDMFFFNKRLLSLKENRDEKVQMRFEDGSIAEADVVIGCDGIKSEVRRYASESDHISNQISYTHMYAYRGVIEMERAVKAVGPERAENSSMHLGRGSHLLTFPIDHGRLLNLVAFHTDPGDWGQNTKMTRKGTRQDLLRDFSGFNRTVTSLLELTTEILDVWGVFDLGDHPLSSFRKGRVCVIGDAAHATSPHHGSGAGFCIEDSAILATLLADQRVISHDDLAMALEAFSSCRKERTQWLVRSSRLNGDVYQCQAPGIGSDPTKIEQHLLQEHSVINDVSVLQLCDQAGETLGRLLSSFKL